MLASAAQVDLKLTCLCNCILDIITAFATAYFVLLLSVQLHIIVHSCPSRQREETGNRWTMPVRHCLRQRDVILSIITQDAVLIGEVCRW